MIQIEIRGKSGEFAVRNFAANQTACQLQSVNNFVRERWLIKAVKCCIDETNVEARIVCNKNRVADEFKKRCNVFTNSGLIANHAVGDTRENDDE